MKVQLKTGANFKYLCGTQTIDRKFDKTLYEKMPDHDLFETFFRIDLSCILFEL